jgi:hypothetical protein
MANTPTQTGRADTTAEPTADTTAEPTIYGGFMAFIFIAWVVAGFGMVLGVLTMDEYGGILLLASFALALLASACNMFRDYVIGRMRCKW